VYMYICITFFKIVYLARILLCIQTFSCEHLKCRSWGDAYGKGVRCLDCGQEMSYSHESAKQQAGIGSGDNPALVEQVSRHRRNEASYRFRTGKEYQAVLKERLRLEKDRREVCF
jgi:hypothetical protein